MANRLLASHHLVNSSTRGPCECCASVRPFVRYRRDTIFSFSLLLRALCSPRRACAPFFTSPSSSSRRWRVEREKERERFDSFPLFFSFFPLLRSMRRDRDILIVGKYYENRIKIEFEKEDGHARQNFIREIVKLPRQPFPRYKMQRSEDQRGHFVIGTSYPGCCISIRKKSLEKRDQMF